MVLLWARTVDITVGLFFAVSFLSGIFSRKTGKK